MDIIKVLRARRLSYLGHILRANEDRLLHIAIGQMQADRKDGDLLMDAPEHSSIAELIEKAKDRDGWRKLVNDLKPPKRKRRKKKQKEECSDAPQAAATAALEDGHDDEVTTSGDGGTNAAVGGDMLETERSDSQPSQAGPYLTGSTQKY